MISTLKRHDMMQAWHNSTGDVSLWRRYRSSAEIWVLLDGRQLYILIAVQRTGRESHSAEVTYYINSFASRDIVLYPGYCRRGFTSIFFFFFVYFAASLAPCMSSSQENSVLRHSRFCLKLTRALNASLSSLPPTLHLFLISAEEMPAPWERGSCSAAPIF